jgi:hypothetical protein
MRLKFALCLLVASAASASAATIDYTTVPTGIYSSAGFGFGGTTVSGSNNIFAAATVGLGVQGGYYDNSLDMGEFLTISYGGEVTNVSVTVFDLIPVGNALLGFNAYDGANNLGFFTFPYATTAPETYSVSSLIANHPITSVSLTEVSGAPAGFYIQGTSFDPAVTTVPEPSSLLLLSTGLVSILRLRYKLIR